MLGRDWEKSDITAYKGSNEENAWWDVLICLREGVETDVSIAYHSYRTALMAFEKIGTGDLSSTLAEARAERDDRLKRFLQTSLFGNWELTAISTFLDRLGILAHRPDLEADFALMRRMSEQFFGQSDL